MKTKNIKLWLVLAAALASGGCPSGGIASTDTDANEVTSTGSPGSTTGPKDDLPSAACDNPAFACTQPVDCEQWNCGALDSPFDASGCLRRACDGDSACDPGEVCYAGGRGDGCAHTPLSCADVGDACECELAEDCVPARHCVPPVECPPYSDGFEACLAAGCWYGHGPVYEIEDGQCAATAQGACVWFPQGGAFGESGHAYYEKSTGLAFDYQEWSVPPHGWGDCDDPDAPSSCLCFGVCGGVQGQVDAFLAATVACDDVSDCLLVDAGCYIGDTCGSVAIHKDNLTGWELTYAGLEANGCCDGAAACVAELACEDQRCVAVVP